MWRRVPSLLLLAAWFALGTGLLAHLHNLQHLEHDHAAAPFKHDDSNCQVHAQLHAPALADAGQVEAAELAPLAARGDRGGQQLCPTARPSACGSRDPPLA